jgi:hypothetical protein
MVIKDIGKPDPTEAVKEALRLAVETINEKFKGSADAVILAREELKLRLDAMSAGINDKFAGNKELVDQLGKANAVALNAALETQKDLLKQLQISFDTSIKVVNEKIDRLTSRIDTGEGRVVQVDSNRVNYHDNRVFYVSIIAIVISAAALIFGLEYHR